MKRKICVVTGARAEYGLLYPLLKKIKANVAFELQIIATGMHLSPEFGVTYKEIEKDGFKITKKVEILLSSGTEAAVTKSIGLGIIRFADVFSRLRPDMVLLLGDRFETFAAAAAAYTARIPIAHLRGGELTEGAIDDAFRHCITKMSMLHFVSTEKYRKRVIQLGESPGRVFNVGAIGIDNIKTLKLLNKKELERELNFKFGEKTALVTFHPVTLENNTAKIQFENLLKALDSFKNLKILFTKPNADTDNRIIATQIDNYVRDNPKRAISFASLGQLKYLSAIKYTDVVAGNSSSGIVEVPSFGKPTVDIGDRQKGRIAAKSVIRCAPKQECIQKALKKAFSRKFNRDCAKIKNPYDGGWASKKIIAILKKEFPRIKSLKKKFYDYV